MTQDIILVPNLLLVEAAAVMVRIKPAQAEFILIHGKAILEVVVEVLAH
jgi:hypothetical protein